MRVIPTLFALALATPALSIPVPRALFARSGPDVGHETSADPSATDAPAPSATDAHAPAPAVNNLVATQTTAALGADPTENERIINDLLTFAHGDPSVLLNQIKPLAFDLSTMVDGMIKGAKIHWMESFTHPAQPPAPVITTVTITSTPTSTSATSSATDTATTSSDTAAATPEPHPEGDEDGETSPPGVEPERRSLHSYSKRAAATCSSIYQSDPGDTCEVVARKFGTSVDALRSANPFLDCNDIWTATSICVPAFTCAQTVTTQDGDTCQSIGDRHHVSATDIQTANVFLNCNSIAPSTEVCIPQPPQPQASAPWGGHGNYGSPGFGGAGVDNNQLGMQYAMLGLGMMHAGMNPDSPDHMPPIQVTPENISKLKAYVERMQLLTTALERLATNGTSAPTVVAAAPTPTPTESTSASATETATTTTDTATESATSTDSAAPTPEADEKHAKSNSHHQASLKYSGKTHPWR